MMAVYLVMGSIIIQGSVNRSESKEQEESKEHSESRGQKQLAMPNELMQALAQGNIVDVMKFFRSVDDRDYSADESEEEEKAPYAQYTRMVVGYIQQHPETMQSFLGYLDRHPEAVDAVNQENGDTLLMEILDTFGESQMIPLIEKAVELTKNIDQKNMDGKTALMKVSYRSNPEDTQIVAKLLAKGAQVDLQDENGSTSLMNAATAGNLATVRLLLDHKANLHLKNSEERTVLFDACMFMPTQDQNAGEVCVGCGKIHPVPTLEDRQEIIKLLLAKGAHINEKDQFGMTPLLYTITFGNFPMAIFLTQNGADVHALDNNGNNALFQLVYGAAKEMDTQIQQTLKELIDLLLTKGLSLESRNNNMSQQTPLMTAVFNSNYPLVKLYLDAGADIEAKDENLSTALITAIDRYYQIDLDIHGFGNQREDISEEFKKDMEKNWRQEKADLLKIIEGLIDRGIQLEKRQNGLTPLMKAIMNANFPVVELLIIRGADVHAISDEEPGRSVSKIIIDTIADIRNKIREGGEFEPMEPQLQFQLKQLNKIASFFACPKKHKKYQKSQYKALKRFKFPPDLANIVAGYMTTSASKMDQIKTIMKTNNVERLQKFINENPEILTQTDELGDTPLLLALKFGNRRLIDAIKRKIDSMLQNPCLFFDCIVEPEELPLMATPADRSFAQQEHQKKMARKRNELVEEYLDKALYAKNKQGFDAKEFAQQLGIKIDLEPELIKSPKKVSIPKAEIERFFMHIRAGKEQEIIQDLKRFPQLASQIDFQGNLPLVVAVTHGNYPLVKLFVEQGASIYTSDKEGVSLEELARQGLANSRTEKKRQQFLDIIAFLEGQARLGL